MSKALEALKLERKALSCDLDKLEIVHDKLVDVQDESVAAKTALEGFDAAIAEAIVDWAAGGCKDPRPVQDANRHRELLHAAQAGESKIANCLPAFEQNEAERRDLSKRLFSVGESIRAEAVRILVKGLAPLAMDTLKLREQVHDNEERLLAANAVFRREKGDNDLHKNIGIAIKPVHHDIVFGPEPISDAGKGLPMPPMDYKGHDAAKEAWRAELASLME